MEINLRLGLLTLDQLKKLLDDLIFVSEQGRDVPGWYIGQINNLIVAKLQLKAQCKIVEQNAQIIKLLKERKI